MAAASKDRRMMEEWDAFFRDIQRQSAVDSSLSRAQRMEKRARLEADPLAWMKEMFPQYCRCGFAPFQRKAVRRIVDHPEWYEVLSWSRSLAKSTVTFMAVMYLVLTGRKKNVLLVSNSLDNAKRLLADYKAAFEKNSRVRHYYGDLAAFGQWTDAEFVTKDGASFRAVGAGQSPRGSRNEAYRPDTFIVDDFDTDEDCRNPDTLRNKWEWWEQAVYAARDTDIPALVVFCGNIIAKDCCVSRAGRKADHWDIVNILDKDGNPAWPQKNSADEIKAVLAKISAASAQKEYFNNPVVEGGTFKEITWGRVPRLDRFDLLVCYADPSPSNKDRQKSGASFKACVLLGQAGSVFYVIKAFCDQVGQDDFIGWFYAVRDLVDGKAQVLYFIENNSLQDPFYQQVYGPLFDAWAGKKGYIPVTPDTRKKPEKAVRIEGNLEPLARTGRLVFNEKEKDDPHMQRLADQFLYFSPQLRYPADGPDAVEGGVYVLNEMKRKLGLEAEFGGFDQYHKNRY